MTPPQDGKESSGPTCRKRPRCAEFTFRAVLLGLVMTGILGAANAYLGLKAGMTIAATYPAAVIGMAVLRLMKGSLLEENIARTIGSIGESVAAGAIFTIPAFVLSQDCGRASLARARTGNRSALMVIGGTLGILFVTLLRRVMVEDPELPFPESVAASEIHKAGQQGSKAAKILFCQHGIRRAGESAGADQCLPIPATHSPTSTSAPSARSCCCAHPRIPTLLPPSPEAPPHSPLPDISPAYLGVGYIIGPRLAALNFAGGVLAWGLLVPLLTFSLGP